MKREPQIHANEKRGFFAQFVEWWRAPFSPWSHYSRTDPRILLILIVGAIALMVFGGTDGLIGGSLVLYFIFTIVVPALWGEALCRRFGSPVGYAIAFAPLWFPALLGLTARWWMPLLGLH